MGYNLRPSTLRKKSHSTHDDNGATDDADADDDDDEDDTEYHTEDTDEDDADDADDADDDGDATQMVSTISISNTQKGELVLTIGNKHMRCADYKELYDEESESYDEDSRANSVNLTEKFSEKETKYWDTLTKDEQVMLKNKYVEVKEKDVLSIIPLKFKILDSDMDPIIKQIILSKIDEFNMMSPHTSEYFKARRWLNEISRLPLGIYHRLPISNTHSTHHTIDQCATFLQNVNKTLNETVYGHNDAKEQVMRVLAQWITNPQYRGHCIGIQGPMGVGKSSLVKDGISKALNIPFSFIALGGASDGSFLDGFSVTYEGSTYGKIAEVLMKAQCMNPIIFFDELDKVSQSSRGDEIIGILTHLTDSVQNEKFNDKYFGEIDLDLSKCLIVFSYNDESLINPILRDRMIQIHVKGYDEKDKLVIAKDHLIPAILKQYMFTLEDVVFTDEIINKIIQRVPEEEGVRNLRRGIESIVSWLNMYRYIPLPPPKKQKVQNDGAEPAQQTPNTRITFPVKLTNDDVLKYVKLHEDSLGSKTYLQTMYT